MSLANQFGCVVLATGNKSEAAVGYATLYGDTAGAISVIGDVTKTMVYQLSEYANRNGEIIPADTISRPPSAELRPGQKDTDSLPDYAILDEILKGHIEQRQSRRQLIENGFDADIVGRVIRMVRLSEYKRRQSPPAIKISPRRLATDRTMPITNRYEPQ
jgi:NAD+ synthase (glutamine-hydrolysing)